VKTIIWIGCARRTTRAPRLHVTNPTELYKIDSTRPDKGPINRLGLYVDEEFIWLATARAAELIFESKRYSALLVFADEKMQSLPS
jgi:hypothetical protein